MCNKALSASEFWARFDEDKNEGDVFLRHRFYWDQRKFFLNFEIVVIVEKRTQKNMNFEDIIVSSIITKLIHAHWKSVNIFSILLNLHRVCVRTKNVSRYFSVLASPFHS